MIVLHSTLIYFYSRKNQTYFGVLVYLAKLSSGKITQKSEVSYYQTAFHWGCGI